jgi:hypothetical protein
MATTKLNLKEAKVAAIVAVFEKAVLAKPSNEYARLLAKGRTAAYLSQRKDYGFLRFDHLAVAPSASEIKAFGKDTWNGSCVKVTDANLEAAVAFATRLVAETPVKELVVKKAPKAKAVKDEPAADGDTETDSRRRTS